MMLPDISREDIWSFAELKKHHEEHHKREAKRLELLRKAEAHLKWFRYVAPDEADNVEGFYEFCDELARELGEQPADTEEE